MVAALRASLNSIVIACIGSLTAGESALVDIEMLGFMAIAVGVMLVDDDEHPKEMILPSNKTETINFFIVAPYYVVKN